MRWRRWILIAAVTAPVLLIVAPAVGLAEFALRRPRPRPAAVPYDAARVRILAEDGVGLVGDFDAAQDVSRRCVVLLHGVGSKRQELPGLQADFRAAGYKVLRPDGRGHGESGGERVTYGLLERGDLRRWVDYLDQQGCGEGIFALGLSMGAAVLLETLPEEPRIRAAVAESSFSSFKAIGEDRVRQMLPSLGLLARSITGVGIGYVNLRYGLDLSAASPAAGAGRVKAPVLLIHGAEDTNIGVKHSRALLPLFGKAELWVVPGARHVGCYERDRVAYMRRVTDWFDAAVLGR